MGDRVYASVSIGGRLESVAEAEMLIAALEDDDLSDTESTLRDMRMVIETAETMNYDDSGVDGGSFNKVEAIVSKIPGLLCVTRYNSGSTFSEGWLLVAHVDGEPNTISIATNDGDPTITYHSIKGMADSDDSLLFMVRRQIAQIKMAEKLPPLTASPAVCAWLKIFGEKAA